MERAITAVRPDAYRSVAAAGVGAGPDEARALAVFIIEEVGVCVSACKIDPYGGVIGIQF